MSCLKEALESSGTKEGQQSRKSWDERGRRSHLPLRVLGGLGERDELVEEEHAALRIGVERGAEDRVGSVGAE